MALDVGLGLRLVLGHGGLGHGGLSNDKKNTV
jgi:hypothetical protein